MDLQAQLEKLQGVWCLGLEEASAVRGFVPSSVKHNNDTTRQRSCKIWQGVLCAVALPFEGKLSFETAGQSQQRSDPNTVKKDQQLNVDEVCYHVPRFRCLIVFGSGA